MDTLLPPPEILIASSSGIAAAAISAGCLFLGKRFSSDSQKLSWVTLGSIVASLLFMIGIYSSFAQMMFIPIWLGSYCLAASFWLALYGFNSSSERMQHLRTFALLSIAFELGFLMTNITHSNFLANSHTEFLFMLHCAWQMAGTFLIFQSKQVNEKLEKMILAKAYLIYAAIYVTPIYLFFTWN